MMRDIRWHKDLDQNEIPFFGTLFWADILSKIVVTQASRF